MESPAGRRLPRWGRRALRSLAITACPPAPPAVLDEVVDRTEALLGGVPPVVRGAVLAELALARLRGGRAATQARGLLVFAYYELPAVTAPLGYDPDRWIGQVRARRDERWGDDVRRHRELLVRPDPLPPLRPPPQP